MGVEVLVVPEYLHDEFTCAQCFLVRHRSQLAKRIGEDGICKECA